MISKECFSRSCTKKPLFKVEKKGDLGNRKAFYCSDCVGTYRDSEEGKKYFDVKKLK